MTYLLDTNVISELRKAKPHGGVEAWFRRHAIGQSNLSAVTIYELQVGVEKTRQQDAVKAASLDGWVRAVAGSITVLPFGAVEARMTAYLMRGTSSDLLLDAMIAATALANDLTLATRNTRDFKQFGASLVNPFDFRDQPHV